MSSKCLLCGDNDWDRWPCCYSCEYEFDDLNETEKKVFTELDNIMPSFTVWEENNDGHCTKNTVLLELQPAKVLQDEPLYIGDIDDAADVENLISLGIGCVVNLCADKIWEYEQLPMQLAAAGIHQHIMYAIDREYFPIINVAEHVADAIAASLSRPQKNGVLIHCYAGKNRSAAVMIHFLTTRKKVPLVTAIQIVMRKRGTILTNKGFRLQLVRHCLKNGLQLMEEPIGQKKNCRTCKRRRR